MGAICALSELFDFTQSEYKSWSLIHCGENYHGIC